jgi:hypothetical protein
VGPDAARIISEIILAEVDKRLKDTAGKHIVGAVRYVDDYFIGTRSETDAALVQSALSDALSEYELSINDVKTRIIATSHPMDEIWPLQLSRLSEDLLSGDTIPDRSLK